MNFLQTIRSFLSTKLQENPLLPLHPAPVPSLVRVFLAKLSQAVTKKKAKRKKTGKKAKTQPESNTLCGSTPMGGARTSTLCGSTPMGGARTFDIATPRLHNDGGHQGNGTAFFHIGDDGDQSPRAHNDSTTNAPTSDAVDTPQGENSAATNTLRVRSRSPRIFRRFEPSAPAGDACEETGERNRAASWFPT